MHTMHLAKLVYTSTLHYGLIVNQKGAIFWGTISVSFLKNDIFILMILQNGEPRRRCWRSFFCKIHQKYLDIF